jgi:hypothetical protein
MTWLALGLVALLVPSVITMAFWARKDGSDMRALGDLLDGERKLSAEYKSQRDVLAMQQTATTHELEQERTLRKLVEAQREEAQERVRSYLARSLATATQHEIDEAIADLFRRAPSLHVVPAKAAEAPATDPNGLIDPFADS